MDEITIPAGTIIHVRGMPLQLGADTVVLGRAENLAITPYGVFEIGQVTAADFAQAARSSSPA